MTHEAKLTSKEAVEVLDDLTYRLTLGEPVDRVLSTVLSLIEPSWDEDDGDILESLFELIEKVVEVLRKEEV